MPLLAWLGGRKFVLAVGCGLITSVMRAANVLSDGGYVTIIMGTVAAYITGNVFQKRREPER